MSVAVNNQWMKAKRRKLMLTTSIIRNILLVSALAPACQRSPLRSPEDEDFFVCECLSESMKHCVHAMFAYLQDASSERKQFYISFVPGCFGEDDESELHLKRFYDEETLLLIQFRSVFFARERIIKAFNLKAVKLSKLSLIKTVVVELD